MPTKNIERAFLRITTPADRHLILQSIGALITYAISAREFTKHLVMRRFFAKNFRIAIGTFLALFLIYLALRFFRTYR